MGEILLKRRDFLRGSALAAGASVLPATVEAATDKDELKICVFADIHYYENKFVNSEIGFMQRILDRAAAAKCE